MDMEEVCRLDKSHPVDNAMIIKSGGHVELEKISVVSFLSQAKTIEEWHSRHCMVNEMLSTIKYNREQGIDYLRKQSEKVMTLLNNAAQEIKSVSRTLPKQLTNQDKPHTSFGRRQHASQKNTEWANEEYSPFSSTCSESSTSTLHMAKALQSVDDEVTGGFGGFGFGFGASAVNKSLKGQIKSENYTSIAVTRLYKMLIRTEPKETALRRAADYLNELTHSKTEKKAVIEYMEKKHSIKWPEHII
ncbi:RING-type E3 ubiquitin transferase [Caenorhabditis elegans]|nr:RING-type E3 ubiquitin transferase [Caenorhabditis elegans]CCE72299.1 RING-type E3 ubiquitin transferase [Caenorhabditis elegans]|eukprot:NP_001252172.1 Uncharacterized protein CELE_Y48G10A.2 [Caenorhabditis elegans]